MSHSENHDQHFEAIARYLRESCGCNHIAIEPARPLHWGDGPWPSPDVYGYTNHPMMSIAVDVKVTTDDCRAQLKKPYVQDARLGVGFMRYLAIPADLRTPPYPDKYGLLLINGGEVSEAWCPKPHQASDRNWRAEACMVAAAKRTENGMSTPPVMEMRDRQERIEAFVKKQGPVRLGRVMKELGVTRQAAIRALATSTKVKQEVDGGATTLVCA